MTSLWGQVVPATPGGRPCSWVAFTDDDCRPDEVWLEGLLTSAGPGVFVVGPMLPDPQDGPVRSILNRTMRIEEQNRRFSTCNILYARDTLERLGGFGAARELTPASCCLK